MALCSSLQGDSHVERPLKSAVPNLALYKRANVTVRRTSGLHYLNIVPSIKFTIILDYTESAQTKFDRAGSKLSAHKNLPARTSLRNLKEANLLDSVHLEAVAIVRDQEASYHHACPQNWTRNLSYMNYRLSLFHLKLPAHHSYPGASDDGRRSRDGSLPNLFPSHSISKSPCDFSCLI